LTNVVVVGANSVAVSTTAQFSAIANYSDGTEYDITGGALWTSSNSSIASVNAAGVVSGVASGSAFIDASYDGIVGGVCPNPPEWDGGCPTASFEGAQSVTVQVPTSLTVLSTNVLTTGGSSVPDHGCVPGFDYGISVDIKYEVWDQQSPPRPIQNATMVPHEHVVWANGQINDNDIGPTRISTTSHTTAADGTFHDAPVQMCSALPSATDSNTQTITIILSGSSYTVRTQRISFSATTLPGHGTVTNDLGDINKTR